jgi:hypothetical protein
LSATSLTIALSAVGLALAAATTAVADAPIMAPPHGRANFTFFWIPKSTDVGAPGSPDYRVLSAILKLVGTETYKVPNGEILDFIIRKQFLVSSSFPRAYTLYRARILELNPVLQPDKLPAGSVIRIPRGPKFGGTELAKANIPNALRPQMFSEMSVKASGLNSPTRTNVLDWSARTLGAYVSPFKKATPSDVRAAINARGLVAPIDVFKHPDSRLKQAQGIDLTATAADESLIQQIVQAAPQDLHTGFFPVDDSFPVDCNGCVSCSQALKLPPGLNLSRARVLIEDTGIASKFIPSVQVLPQYSGDDGSESAANSHGTFVFSEIVAPGNGDSPQELRGIIPKASVYVSRVTQTTAGQQTFSMSYMLQGWQTFQAQLIQDMHAAKTGVINISAASGPDPQGTQPPTILDTDNLLFVAAAGNDNSSTEPLRYAFGRFASPGTPLLIVGAQEADGKKKAVYSNFSASNVHFMAPGNCVCGAPGQLNGTSQATPVVSAAAAVLASQRSDWTAIDVMWRLVATADQAPELVDGVFAGTVDIGQALDTLMIVKEGTDSTISKVHRVSSLTFDANWMAQLHANSLDDSKLPLLRLYAPTMIGTQRCFSAVRYMQADHKQVCVDPNSVLSMSENGNKVTLHAQDIADVILVMPTDRDSSATWPSVGVAGGTN